MYGLLLFLGSTVCAKSYAQSGREIRRDGEHVTTCQSSFPTAVELPMNRSGEALPKVELTSLEYQCIFRAYSLSAGPRSSPARLPGKPAPQRPRAAVRVAWWHPVRIKLAVRKEAERRWTSAEGKDQSKGSDERWYEDVGRRKLEAIVDAEARHGMTVRPMRASILPGRIAHGQHIAGPLMQVAGY